MHFAMRAHLVRGRWCSINGWTRRAPSVGRPEEDEGKLGSVYLPIDAGGRRRFCAAKGGEHVIARIWHGRVPVDKADTYHEYLLKTGIADYRATPGNRGVYVMRRVEEQVAHFKLLTFWDSVEAIKAFTGDDYERARYYPEDDEFLLEREPHVTHLEVLYAAPEPAA